MVNNSLLERYSRNRTYLDGANGLLSLGANAVLPRINCFSEVYKPPEGDVCSGCMDEGGPMVRLRWAGNGILNQSDTKKEIPDVVVECLEKEGVKIIIGHEGCGAGVLAYQTCKFVRDMGGNAERATYNWTRWVADRLGLRHEHISLPKMTRPDNLHNAVTVYWRAIPFFPPRVEGLPKGFVVSGRSVSCGHSIKDVDLSVKIALGNHGFSDLFTKEKPFVIIPVTDTASRGTDYSLKRLVEMAGKVAGKYGGRVVVRGFEKQ